MIISPEEKTRRLDTIARAIDWLEAHPERHIAHKMATTGDHKETSPKDPSADCFCALGRIVVEADIEYVSSDKGWALSAFFTPLGISFDTVYHINDHHVASFHKDKAIKALRQYMLEGQMV